MEQDLNAELPIRCKDIKAFEVINLGIPHMTTWKIYSILMEEALPLHPDVVTFYEGVNNAASNREYADELVGFRSARRFLDRLGSKSVSFLLIDDFIKDRIGFS